MSLRLDRLGQGVFEALSGVADVVAWAYGEQPRVEGSLLSMRLSGGPTPGHRQRARGYILCPADSITLTVTAVTVGSKQIVRLNDFDYSHEVTGADTLTTIRDDLLAQIQAGERDFMTAAANGADAIDLTASFLGGLRSLFLVGGDIADGGSAVFSGDAVLVTEGTVNHTLQLQAYARGHEPRNGAWAIIHAALERLQQMSVSDALAAYGVGLGSKGPPVDLSAIAGANWTTRAAADVQLFSRYAAVEDADHIETVNANITASGNLVAASVTAP